MYGHPYRQHCDTNTIERELTTYCWIARHYLKCEVRSRDSLTLAELPGIKLLLRRGANAAMCGMFGRVGRRPKFGYIAGAGEQPAECTRVQTKAPYRVLWATDLEENINLFFRLGVVPR